MRKSKRKITNNQKPIINKMIIIFVFLAFGFLSFIFFKVATLDKFIYVNKSEDGSAEIITDSFIYKIPADTELESARGYGKYKLSSLWTLSEKDNIGKLIPETIVKNFSLPVFLWKNGNKSNLNVYQKIKITFSKVNRSDEIKINSTKLSNSILIQFINPKLAEITPKIDVEDLTNNLGILEKVSKIIEVLGGKITTNSKGYDANLDCEISGKEMELINIFSSVFGCEKREDKTLSSDLKIRLGVKFAERF